jgi:hypothetical protein
MLIAIRLTQAFAIPAGDDQLPSAGGELAGQCPAKAAGGTGYQCSLLHVASETQ